MSREGAEARVDRTNISLPMAGGVDKAVHLILLSVMLRSPSWTCDVLGVLLKFFHLFIGITDAPSTLVNDNMRAVRATRAPISGGIEPVCQRAAEWSNGVRSVYIISLSAAPRDPLDAARKRRKDSPLRPFA